MRRIVFSLVIAVLFAQGAARASCSWTSNPTNINFGTYSVFGVTALTATSTFRFNCTANTTVTVSLSRGSSATYNPRTMLRTTAPVVAMNYNIYDDAANTIIWGDGTGGSQADTVTAGGGGTTFTGTSYGTVPPGLDVSAGTYLDTIQVTLTWAGGTAFRTFTVTATVSTVCSVSTLPVTFGVYDPVAVNLVAPKDANGTVNVLCTMGTPVTVALGLGSHATGTTRRMLGTSADLLTYEVYRDSGRTVIWNAANLNNGTSASKLTAIGGGFLGYGRIFGGQDVGVGSYTDSVLVTVNY
jgi:spore coat protein U-like protein